MYSLNILNLGTGEYDNPYNISVWRHSYGKHGCLKLTLTFETETPLYYMDNDGVLLLTACLHNAPVWRGRSEKISVQGNKVSVEALGLIRIFADIPSLFELSTTNHSRLRPLNQSDRVDFNEDMYMFDTNNRGNMGLKKGATYNAASDRAVLGLKLSGSARKTIKGIQYSLSHYGPAQMGFRAYPGSGYDFNPAAYYGPMHNFTGNGVVNTTAIAYQETNNDAGLLILFMVPLGAFTFAGEDGANYMRVTNFRMVTDDSRMINTTLSGAVVAGSNVLITVGSTANMIVGCEVAINANTFTNGEMITVLEIVSSTQFRANLAKSHGGGAVVRGFVTPPDVPIKILVSGIVGTHPTMADPNTSFIQTFPVDITDADYFKLSMLDTIQDVLLYGDGATPSSPLRLRIFADKIARLESAAYGAQTWYIHLKDLEIERSLEESINTALAYYTRADGTTQITDNTYATERLSSMGFYRVGTVEVSTQSATVANRSRNAFLSENKYEGATLNLEIAEIVDSSGAEASWENIRADDRCILMDLPSRIAGGTLDRLRNFRIGEVEIDVMKGELKISPDFANPFVSFFAKR